MLTAASEPCWVGPSRWEATAPIEGYRGLRSLPLAPSRPVSIQWAAAQWSPLPWEKLRITVHLSITLACSGSSSQTSIPGTLEWIGWNAPRNSDGALGFMSKVSSCDGPPCIQTRITDFLERAAGWSIPADSARSRLGRLSPNVPIAPTCSILRREMWSQNKAAEECWPRMLNMVEALHGCGPFRSRSRSSVDSL